MKIRKAVLKDLKAIQKLNQLHFRYAQKKYEPSFNPQWPIHKEGEKWFKKALTSSKRIIFIAEENSKIAGYVACSSGKDLVFKGKPIFTEIDDMFILEKYRGQKIGTQLVQGFLDWSKKLGAKSARVYSDVQNKKGLSFYKKQGFKEKMYSLKIDF